MQLAHIWFAFSAGMAIGVIAAVAISVFITARQTKRIKKRIREESHRSFMRLLDSPSPRNPTPPLL